MSANADDLKGRLPDYLAAIGTHPTKASETRLSACCPIHDERTPSFTSDLRGDAWVWHCFGCSAGGTIYDLHAALNGLTLPRDMKEAAEGIARIVGGGFVAPAPRAPAPPRPPEHCSGPKMPADLTRGTVENWKEVATRRQVSLIAVATAALKLGTLRFGTVCGFRSWILSDRRGLCAEARRLDGNPYPSGPAGNERKAHTLPGSKKSWPVGLVVNGFEAHEFRALMIVEGGPDYLAALQFSLAGDGNCLPVAILGASNSIHPEALGLMAGSRLRFYPHADESGGGAVARWARELEGHAAGMDKFNFQGLRMANGTRVKDLNDCTRIHAEDAAELEGILP